MPPTASCRRRKSGRRTSLIVIDLPGSKCENACYQILPDRLTSCQGGKMAGVAQVRPYRGVEAADRLAAAPTPAAGRRPGPARRDIRPHELTVRGDLQAGRADRPLFLRELHRQGRVRRRGFRLPPIADIAATTQAAVAAAAPAEQGRAAMANLVRTISRRPPHRPAAVRRPTVQSGVWPQARRSSAESSPLLTRSARGQHVLAYRERAGARRPSHFVVGGVGQTISAWLAGEIDLSQDAADRPVGGDSRRSWPTRSCTAD